MKPLLLTVFVLTIIPTLVAQQATSKVSQNSHLWKQVASQRGTQDINTLLDLPDDFSLVKKWEREDTQEFRHVKYQIRCKNLEVYGAELIAHFDTQNRLVLINGNIPSNIKVSEFHSSNCIILSSELVDELSTDLVVSKRYDFQTQNWMFYNGQGEPVFSLPFSKHFTDSGTAVTKYSGTQKIITKLSDRQDYILSEIRNGTGIKTYNAETKDIDLLTSGFTKAPDFETLSFFSDNDNFWNNKNDQQDEIATDIHWSTETTFDYFLEKHDWLGIDGVGGEIISIAHIGKNWDEAFYLPPPFNFIGYGDGGPIGPNVTLDVVAHEFTHAVVHYSAGLIYIGESSVLDEGLADIFSAAVKFYEDLPQLKTPWILAEQLGAFRNMSDPEAMNQPDTYKGKFWYNGDTRVQFAHQNNGVLNYWFYLLTDGGLGKNDNGHQYSIDGIGIEKSATIVFDAMRFYLTALSDFFDFKAGTIQSAINIYGENSVEAQTVKDCWEAVGVVDTITSLEDEQGESFQISLDQQFLTIKTVEYPLLINDITFHDLKGRKNSINIIDTGDYEYSVPIGGFPPGIYVLLVHYNQSYTAKKVLIRNF